jgi:ABC-type transport system substrate-binding protein
VGGDAPGGTFSLRQDAKCADGTQVTPTVVANSFDRLFTVKKMGYSRLAPELGTGSY